MSGYMGEIKITFVTSDTSQWSDDDIKDMEESGKYSLEYVAEKLYDALYETARDFAMMHPKLFRVWPE